ncbi:alpha-glucosidase family protein [Chthonobacter rhizosphaerae]|uniref:beta-galactosidase BglA n=1 Tax=Chthonobacter rhizosphaerae TaxID=2735553 RepID=UPI0015EE9383|nr:alpha-glucosidase family protein [Chthonobacter rhizosphaerae]
MNKPVLTSTAASRFSSPDWWRGAVIYQIYPRSFQDSNGDGIGDLPGITRRLGYVADLGVDAIWLSPFFTSPMRDFGYDVSDYRDVDPIFGTLKDFEALVAEAHRLGMKVMIDQVLSHTSDQHPWFAESRKDKTKPKADWYVWADAKPDGTAPTNWLSVFGGPAWEWDSRRCQYYLHNFLASQPDLNFHNEEVVEALLADVEFWLKLGVDGFRLDTVNYYFHDQELRSNPPMESGPTGNDAPAVNPYGRQLHVYDKTRPENIGFLRKFRALLDRYPGTTAVGEVGDGDRSLDTMAEYTSGGDKLHMCYTFDFLGNGYGREFVTNTLHRFETRATDGWPCWAWSNHDVMRHYSRFMDRSADPERLARLMGSLLLSFRGSVCLYQGEELGLTEADLAFEDLVDPYGIRFWPEFKGRDGCRTPMVWEAHAPYGGFSTARPWLPVPAEHAARAPDTQVGDPRSLHAHYKRFIHFRRSEAALFSGDIEFLPTEGEVLAFFRRQGNEALLCVFNLGGEAAAWTLPDGIAVEAITGLGFTGADAGGVITLGPEDAFFGRVA